MSNYGQQKRIADKLTRNLKQILTTADGLTVTHTTNSAGDNLVAIAPSAGSWASGSTYILVKIQEQSLSSFPVQGYPVNKIMLCLEGDNGTLGSCKGSKVDAGIVAEVLSRCKDMGCGLEVYLTAAATQPADDATGGTFNGGTCLLKRQVRASVDTLGLGQ